MKQVFLLVCVTCVLALPALPVQGQEWSAEQLEVWQIISKQWDLEKAGDEAWMELLHPSFQAWPNESPMPLDKTDAARFIAAEAGRFKIVAQDLAPVGIVVTGDTAVIHYFHTTITEYSDGERETAVGRSTDVLTRTEDGWRFVSFVGDEKVLD